MNIEICPFCGSNETEVVSGWDCFYVECENCNSEGSTLDTKEESIKAWNQRSGFAISRHSKRLVEQLRKENEELKFILEGLKK